MLDMRYTVDIPDLDKLQRAFAQAPQLVAREVVTAGNRSLVRYQASARQNAPVDTAQLRGGIQIEPMRQHGHTIQGRVAATAKHSLWQEQGTGIYGPAKTPIRPRNSKLLVFTIGGRKVFARQVKGIRPRWFMRDSVRDNAAATQGDFAKATQNVVAALGGQR